MSKDNNVVSQSFESDVILAEKNIAEINAQYELQDQEDFVIVEALSIMKNRAKKYGQVFTSVSESALFFMLDLTGQEKEIFRVAYLNNKHRLIKCETLAIGTIDSATVSIREIAKLALQHNASAVVLAHNHPSGEVTPSHSDKVLTQRVVTALDLFTIRVLDHIVVADDLYHSLRENDDVQFQTSDHGITQLS